MNAIAHASALPATGPQLDNRRVLAGVIDLLVLVAGGVVISLVAGALGGGEVEFTPALDVVLLGWALYYYFACESGGGQTVGKRAMGLRVVRADGSAADMREIFVRTILRVIDGLFLYLVGLVAMLVSGQRRQRLGDMAAGTIVVDARRPAPAVDAAVVVPAAPEAPVASHPGGIKLPEAPPVPEMRPFDPEPVEEYEPDPEPVALTPSEPVVEAEPEPVIEVEPEPEPDPAPAPALGYDPAVESAPTEPVPAEPLPSEGLVPVPPPAEVAEQPVPLPPEPPAEDAEHADPVVIKSVETVSAIDLVMGEDEDDSRGAPQVG